MTTRAAIYCRISHDPTDSQAGVRRQEEDCRALCTRKGWDVAGVYVDNDVSAFSRRPRPEYVRMLDDVKNGVVDAVVAWHPDRFQRSPRDLEDFIDLIEGTKTPVATCTAGDYDLGTPDGRLMARIVGSVARKESEDKSRRLRRKHEELAAQGRVGGGGVRPFGFKPAIRRDDGTPVPGTHGMEVDEEEASLLRDAARRVLAGDTLYRIVQDWTATGVATSTGVPWSTTSLKSTLIRPRVAGLRAHNGDIVGKAAWAAILDEATWRQVCAVLTDPGRRKNAVVRSYLLSGMLRCATCGAGMVAAPRAGTQRKGGKPGASIRAYGCHVVSGGCGHTYGLADPIEAMVTEAVLAKLDRAGLRAARSSQEGPDDVLGDAIAADEAQLAELADDWADNKITRMEWLRARDRVEVRLADRRRQVRRRPINVLDGLTDLRAEWDALSLDRRRAIIAAVLDRVTLAPATGIRNRFDPDRVGFEWRA